MDAKITKQRLSRLLSYDWLKIVGLIVGAILIWSLIFTTTATRITSAQQFTVFNYYCNGSLGDGFYDRYDKLIDNKVFSYEILETNTNDLVTSGEKYVTTILDARLSTGEGDLMFVPKLSDKNYAVESTDEESGETTTTYALTYLDSFFNRYYYYMIDVDKFITDMENYVNGYYDNGDYTTGTLNEEKIERDFRARIARNKDKRFKKEAQIQETLRAENGEIARIRMYAEALTTFKGYVDNGYVSYEYVALKDANGNVLTTENGDVAFAGNYAINLCPDVDKTGDLKKQFYYYETVTDGSGETTNKATAKDMCVLFFDLPDVEEGFQYESLLYVNEVIRTSIVRA